MNRLRVGVTEKNRGPYWDMVNAGWRDAGERLDLTVEIAAPEHEDIDEQVRLMRAQLASGVDALAFVATRADAFADVVAEAAAAGVPSIAFDLDAPLSGRLLFIGMEPPEQAGRRAGLVMSTLVGDGATVILQNGSATAPGAAGKRRGFLQVMAEHDIHVLEPPVDHEDAAVATQYADSLLRSSPRIDGMFGVYGYHPIAQAQAASAVGRAGAVRIVGFDMLPETVSLIESGVVDASTWIQEYYFGYFAAAAISDIVRLGVGEALRIRGMDPQRLEGNTYVPEPVTYTPATIGSFREWSGRVKVGERTTATHT